MKDNLLQKFLKFSYGSWVSLIIGVAVTMITTRILPPEFFGQFSMFTLFLQVGMILTVFGTDQSFVRFFYEEEPEKRGALLYNSLRIPIFSTILLLIVLFFTWDKIAYFIVGYESIKLSILLAIGIISQLFFRYGQLVIRMQQKGNLYSILQILQKVFNLTFILLFFYLLGSKFEILVYANVITLFILVTVSIYFGKEFWNVKNLSIKDIKHSQKEIIGYGVPLVFTIFITFLFESFDKIALRQWSDFEQLGLYTAAMRLVAMVMILKQTFSTFWTPVAYEKFEKEPDDKDFFKYISIIVSVVMFLVAIISIAGKEVIVLLLGANFKDSAVIMPFLIFMPVLYTISRVTVMGINFYKKTKWHILISGLSCLVNILGNWILVPLYGAIGASIATAIAFVIYFILRTQISQIYYYVAYPLVRIYLMVAWISCYALWSMFNQVIWLNVIGGFISILFLLLIFYRDLFFIFRNRRMLFK